MKIIEVLLLGRCVSLVACHATCNSRICRATESAELLGAGPSTIAAAEIVRCAVACSTLARSTHHWLRRRVIEVCTRLVLGFLACRSAERLWLSWEVPPTAASTGPVLRQEHKHNLTLRKRRTEGLRQHPSRELGCFRLAHLEVYVFAKVWHHTFDAKESNGKWDALDKSPPDSVQFDYSGIPARHGFNKATSKSYTIGNRRVSENQLRATKLSSHMLESSMQSVANLVGCQTNTASLLPCGWTHHLET